MWRQFANIVTLSVVVAFNALSQTLPLNGQTSADIANRYPDLLYFPANWAFGIWGIIYSLLIAFTIYQALPSQRENPVLRKLGYLFVWSGVFNVAWLTCFHYNQYPLSMVMMIMLLGVLLTIYLRLDIGGAKVSRATKLLIHVPFSTYLGWITAATVTNAAYTLRDLNWNGFGLSPEIWTVLLLVITGALGVLMLIRRSDIAYSLVVIWAVSAIASRHADKGVVLVTSLVVVAAVAIVCLGRIVQMFGGGGGSLLRMSRNAA
jgi:tryptophan-rich sensory protein